MGDRLIDDRLFSNNFVFAGESVNLERLSGCSPVVGVIERFRFCNG